MSGKSKVHVSKILSFERQITEYPTKEEMITGESDFWNVNVLLRIHSTEGLDFFFFNLKGRNFD